MASKDGKYLFTASKNIIHIWELNYGDLEEQVNQPHANPFLEILESEPSKEESRYREMENFFYFIQIKK